MKPLNAAPTRDRRLVVALLAALLVAGVFAWVDRSSLERANRMFRKGEVESAVALYRARAESSPLGTAAYNLGTALVGAGEPEGELHLLAAAAGSDSTASSRAWYNLGYLYLSRLDASAEPDSAVQILTLAVESSRAALRIDPLHEDARWNLALGQRMLDSLTRQPPETDGRDPQEQPPGEFRENEDVVPLGAVENPSEAEVDDVSPSSAPPDDGEADPDEVEFGAPPDPDEQASEPSDNPPSTAQAARETWTSQDPGPLGEAGALDLLERINDDPELLIRGILWSHRPDVAWWDNQPFPGGNW